MKEDDKKDDGTGKEYENVYNDNKNKEINDNQKQEGNKGR